MIVSEILSIGDELLRGDVFDTNSQWLGKKVTKLGMKTRKITTVGDDRVLIGDEIRRAVGEDVDLLITTGGLGPTSDDCTLEALSLALGRERQIDKEALEMIREKYSKLAKEGRTKEEKLTTARKKMAKLPSGTKPIPNPVGTAPAVFAEKGDTKIICLPGIPKEMKATFRENLDVFKTLEPVEREHSRILKIFGRGESSLAPLYQRIQQKFPDASVSSYPSVDEKEKMVKVRIVGKDVEHLSEIVEYLKKLVGDLKDADIET